MSEIIKSNNEQGNPWHSGDDGKFTSPNGDFNSSKRKQLINPFSTSTINNTYSIMAKKMRDNFALDSIMKETRYDYQQAKEFQNYLLDYMGGGYEDYSAGRRKEEVEIINRGLLRMPKYDGEIHRGINFINASDEKNKFDNLLASLQVGNQINFRDSISSWTSDKSIAYDQFGMVEFSTHNSLLFLCKNNKTGVGVQHISPFGLEEKEVLVPSTTKYRVSKVNIKNKIDPIFGETNAKMVVIELEEI